MSNLDQVNKVNVNGIEFKTILKPTEIAGSYRLLVSHKDQELFQSNLNFFGDTISKDTLFSKSAKRNFVKKITKNHNEQAHIKDVIKKALDGELEGVNLESLKN